MTAFKLAAAIAALVLLEKKLGVKVLANELAVQTDAKGCGACFRLTYFADGRISSKRVDDQMCRDDGLDGLGCPGDSAASDSQSEPSPFAPGAEFMRGVASWAERQLPSSVRNDGRTELA